jgi:hypothetical protein
MTLQEGIPEFLTRKKQVPSTRLIGTYTILQGYKNCPHAMMQRYIKKDQPYVESPAMAWGNKVHSAFEFRISAKKPLPADMTQWEGFAVPFDGRRVLVEQKLGVTSEGKPIDFWDKEECWFRGKADAVIIDEELAFIADFKTGSSDYEDPFELATNAVLLKVAYPNLSAVFGSYIWLKENRVGQKYDLSDFRETWREMCRLMGEIEADRASGKWAKIKSGLCGYCSVKDCENHYVARKG